MVILAKNEYIWHSWVMFGGIGLFGPKWVFSNFLGYFRVFWGKMGMIDFYGVFSRFLG